MMLFLQAATRGQCILSGMSTTLMLIGIGIMAETVVEFPYKPVVGLVVFVIGAVIAFVR